MFPWWGLSGEVFGRMVLVDPSDAEIEQLQKLFYEQKGILYTGISTEDFTQITTSASIRAHRLYILFYLLSGALLVILLICNIIRIIETHVAEYTVHHLTVLRSVPFGGGWAASCWCCISFQSSGSYLSCSETKWHCGMFCRCAWHLLPACAGLRPCTPENESGQ